MFVQWDEMCSLSSEDGGDIRPEAIIGAGDDRGSGAEFSRRSLEEVLSKLDGEVSLVK